ncbi:MAG: signal recognition particle protein [Bradymonadales bacterium]|nr:signal recognition particle protein [Bradymonadales bacterium]
MAMFETVSNGFKTAKNLLSGKRQLTEENIEEALKSIRLSLFQADVNYKVAKEFIQRVKEKALGEVVQVSVKHQGQRTQIAPGDRFIKICHDELEELMGPEPPEMAFNPPKDGPTKVMLVGLQGSGKTTTAAKLARWMIHHHEKKPLLVAADVYRPAAVEQLRVLGERLEIPVYREDNGVPPTLCANAVKHAVQSGRDVIIYDTAGRLAVDDLLMSELEEIVAATHPEYVYLVCDAMIGQDAVTTAKEFNSRLDLSGFIMTKMDGDARGGAALSIKEVTGKPIAFVGLGEGLDNLQEFRAEGIANRILGFGDIVGMVERMENIITQREIEEREKDAERMLRGDFDFHDFLEQVKVIRRMGSLAELLEMMPFGDKLPKGFKVDESEFLRIESMILSMTPHERKTPQAVQESITRQRRIARGSGRNEEDVRSLLHRFSAMREMLRALGSGSAGFLSKLPGFKQLAQLRQLKGMDIDGIFGEPAGTPPKNAPLPGLPFGSPKSKGSKERSPSAASPQRGGHALSAAERNKRKAKRRDQKKARQRQR